MVFAALSSLQNVVMVTVTPPGADVLPWDEAWCSDRGPHRHSGSAGCRIQPAALSRWHESLTRRWAQLHQAAQLAAQRQVGRRAAYVTRAVEPQKRGAAHLHPVLVVGTPDEYAAAVAYAENLSRLARDHGFGFVDTKLEWWQGSAAAAYLSSYFVGGKGRKAQLHEAFVQLSGFVARPLWVAPRLTQASGVTMGRLRRVRLLWAVLQGLAEMPSWSDEELGDVVRVFARGSLLARAP